MFADGSKILTDQSGFAIGIIEARPPYRAKSARRRGT
jgi:hypothetical protein